jgi:DNA ligase D-like protein (predicted ligase)
MTAMRAKAIPFTSPMECLPAGRLPEGPGWVYELKLDGYRAQAIRDSVGVRLLSRNGKDFSKKFPGVFAALKDAMPNQTVVDGELVAFDADGKPSFNELQNAHSSTNIVLFIFDVLTVRGRDVKALPLRDRVPILQSALVTSNRVQRSEQFAGGVQSFLSAVRSIGGEGVVAKRLDGRYEPGKRSGAWQKMRINLGQEFVIGGFTPGNDGFDALVVGFYDGGSLQYSARVRAGFVPASRREIYQRLKPLITEKCPFANLPEATSGRWGQGLTAAKMRECTWVRPKLVAHFEFLEWAGGNHVRHIKFVRMRDDKDPKSVVHE